MILRRHQKIFSNTPSRISRGDLRYYLNMQGKSLSRAPAAVYAAED